MKHISTTTVAMIFLATLTFFLGCDRQGSIELPEEGITVRDNGSGTGTTTWTADNEYFLDGFVFVNDGDVLTIEAGTVIRARRGVGENASALIIANGGRIEANGTKEKPIVFTTEGDDLQGSIAIEERGLWGGIILLGSAPINTETGEEIIEGIPIGELRAVYGGDNENHNGGTLRYVSILHGGTNIGEGNEINGLTLGGVGEATTIEYIEVVSNEDDGVEILGGTVNLNNILVAFCGDDCFDFDLGYQGNLQFIAGIQSEGLGDLGLEINGNARNNNRTPFTMPIIHNLTFVGKGSGIETSAIVFQDNAAGTIANSIVGVMSYGIEIEHINAGFDSYQHFTAGRLNYRNNTFFDLTDEEIKTAVNTFPNQNSKTEEQLSEGFVSNQNGFETPTFTIDTETPYYNLRNAGLTNTTTSIPSDGWFRITNFRGAFGEDNWIENWTQLHKRSYVN